MKHRLERQRSVPRQGLWSLGSKSTPSRRLRLLQFLAVILCIAVAAPVVLAGAGSLYRVFLSGHGSQEGIDNFHIVPNANGTPEDPEDDGCDEIPGDKPKIPGTFSAGPGGRYSPPGPIFGPGGGNGGFCLDSPVLLLAKFTQNTAGAPGDLGEFIGDPTGDGETPCGGVEGIYRWREEISLSDIAGLTGDTEAFAVEARDGYLLLHVLSDRESPHFNVLPPNWSIGNYDSSPCGSSGVKPAPKPRPGRCDPCIAIRWEGEGGAVPYALQEYDEPKTSELCAGKCPPKCDDRSGSTKGCSDEDSCGEEEKKKEKKKKPKIREGKLSFEPDCDTPESVHAWFLSNESCYPSLPCQFLSEVLFNLPCLGLVPAFDVDTRALHHSADPGEETGFSFDEDDCSGSGPSDVCWARLRARTVESKMEYVFTSTRPRSEIFPGGSYVDDTVWTTTDPSAAGTRGFLLDRVNASTSGDSHYSYGILTTERTVVAGQTKVSAWKDAQDPSSRINFTYDSAGNLTKAETTSGQFLELSYGYASDDHPVYPSVSTALNTTRYQLEEVAAGCQSCAGYSYAYDSNGRITLLQDGQGNTHAAYEYADITHHGPALTKVYRSESGGSTQPVFAASYDPDEWRITQYAYVDGSGDAEIVVDHYSAYFRDLTKRSMYPTLDFQPAGTPDEMTFTHDYSAGPTSMLESREITLPGGVIRRQMAVGAGSMGEGRLSRVEFSAGGSTQQVASYSYSESNDKTLVTSSEDLRGQTSSYFYDTTGKLTLEIDPEVTLWGGGSAQVTKEYKYDEWGRIESTFATGPSGTSINLLYDYDEFGNSTRTILDPSGAALTTSYGYSASGQLTRSVSPRGVDVRQEYTAEGALTKQYTLAAGSSTDTLELHRYEYDDYDRLTKSRVGLADAGVTIDKSSTGPFVDDVYQYDAFGNQTRSIRDSGGLNLTTTYEYDRQDRITKTVMPDGMYSATERDGRGRVSRQILGPSAGNALTTAYFYDARGNLTRQESPDGTTMDYSYDLYDRQTKSVETP